MFDEKIQAVVDLVDQLRHTTDDHWQIPADEARVLAQLVRMAGAASICEVGHSYGFSTLHLAAAAKENGGKVHSFDKSEKKHIAATRHLEQAGLLDAVKLHLGEAPGILSKVQPASPYDFLFIDANKGESIRYIETLRPLMARRCWIVTDNITTHAKELTPYVALMREWSVGKTCAVPVGNGFELTLVGNEER